LRFPLEDEASLRKSQVRVVPESAAGVPEIP